MLGGNIHRAYGEKIAEEGHQRAPALVQEALVFDGPPRKLEKRQDGKQVAEESHQVAGNEPHEVGLRGEPDGPFFVTHGPVSRKADTGRDAGQSEEQNEQCARTDFFLCMGSALLRK
ncbi:hypothetical protein PG988_012823 [Apiospora saccharicola]